MITQSNLKSPERPNSEFGSKDAYLAIHASTIMPHVNCNLELRTTLTSAGYGSEYWAKYPIAVQTAQGMSVLIADFSAKAG